MGKVSQFFRKYCRQCVPLYFYLIIHFLHQFFSFHVVFFNVHLVWKLASKNNNWQAEQSFYKSNQGVKQDEMKQKKTTWEKFTQCKFRGKLIKMRVLKGKWYLIVLDYFCLLLLAAIAIAELPPVSVSITADRNDQAVGNSHVLEKVSLYLGLCVPPSSYLVSCGP